MSHVLDNIVLAVIVGGLVLGSARPGNVRNSLEGDP
jgi:hypothetical protein